MVPRIKHIENFYNTQKELLDKVFLLKEEELKSMKHLYEEIITAKNEEITRLQRMLGRLMEQK